METTVASLQVHMARRMESLAEALAERLRPPRPGREMVPLQVVVGSRGMERWLRLELARHLGVASNLQFPFPGQALHEAFGLGSEALDPWQPDALAWRLVAALPTLLPAPEFAPLRDWLARSAHASGVVDLDTWSLAREVADVLDKVAMYRPAWIDAWLAGQDAPLAPAWQRLLWTHIYAEVGQLPVAQRLRQATPVVTQPDAIHIFGVSAMPPLWVDAWRRVAAVRDVHLYQLVPSEQYWGDTKSRAELRPLSPAASMAQQAEQHPLLSAFGRVVRDQVELLLEAGANGVETATGFESQDRGLVLDWLHDDLQAARPLAEIRALRSQRTLSPTDTSVQLHACHSPTRQVEALREALLALLEATPDLELRDILVMTPAVDTYAPLVKAVFGEGLATRQTAPGPGGLPVGWGDVGGPALDTYVSDLGLRSLNPLADVTMRLLELAAGRVTAAAVLDLLATGPVRQKLSLSEDDLDMARDWLTGAGARLGLDAADRARMGLPETPEYTLAFALDRLALGVAMADEGQLVDDRYAPFDDMEGAAIERFGRLAEACARVSEMCTALRAQTALPIPAWRTLLDGAVASLAELSHSASFLRGEMQDAWDALVEQAQTWPGDVTRDTIAHLLEQRMSRGRGDRARTGAITVCSLAPMRSVPFRVIVLLGMDDGAFPRTGTRRGFDAVAQQRQVGDREARDEDRNLLLEAVLSARDHLLVFYTGHDSETDNALAPAVPVCDLLEVLDDTFDLPADLQPSHPKAHLALRVAHSVQPFSPSGFVGHRMVPGPAPRRFDLRMFDVARTLQQPRVPRGPLMDWLLDVPLPPELGTPTAGLTLDELVMWLRQPLRQFAKLRLGLRLGVADAAIPEREVLDATTKEDWVRRNALVEAWLQGLRDPDFFARRELAHARLPPGQAGRQDVRRDWQGVLALSAGRPDAPPERSDVPVRLHVGGVELVGRVPLWGGELQELALEATDKPRRLLRMWVYLLALAAQGHPAGRRATLVGIQDKLPPTQTTRVLLAPADPLAVLADLVDLVQTARTRPLPLVEKTSHAWATATRDKAAGQWLTDEGAGESSNPLLALQFPDAPPWEATTREAGEFDTLAKRLWTPIVGQPDGADVDSGGEEG